MTLVAALAVGAFCALLTGHLVGRPVELRSAAHTPAPRYENTTDPEHEASAPWEEFTGAERAFHRLIPRATSADGSLMPSSPAPCAIVIAPAWRRRQQKAKGCVSGCG